MKTLLLAIAVIWAATSSFGQEIEQKLKPFTRLVASPRIHVILTEGDREAIRLVYSGVSADKINIDVSGKTLRLYLEGARKIERMVPSDEWDGEKKSMYDGASVTAFITYRELEMLEIRGEQELTCESDIHAKDFRLRAYGENDISLASLDTDFFKVKLYGENRLRIKQGTASEQRYSLYGKNKIDARALHSDYISTQIFGEGSLKVSSRDEVHIHAIGEPLIRIDGGAHISRGLIIGKANIRRE